MKSLRAFLAPLAAFAKSVGVADVLLSFGSIAASLGSSILFGFAVTMLAGGLLAIAAGVALVIREGRK